MKHDKRKRDRACFTRDPQRGTTCGSQPYPRRVEREPSQSGKDGIKDHKIIARVEGVHILRRSEDRIKVRHRSEAPRCGNQEEGRVSLAIWNGQSVRGASADRCKAHVLKPAEENKGLVDLA